MSKQRDAVRMSDEEVWTFLENAHSLQVATIGKDGAPHLTTVWFGIEDGKILFETYGKSQKVVNLYRDNRIALLAEDGDTYDKLRGVSINGSAEIIDENPRRTEAMRFLVQVHFKGQSEEELDRTAEQMARKRIVVAVTPEKVMSWDHTKLGGKGP
ncbi:MAG: PPOX class F420-dependent oxidoreductase [Novosphingobium sp.]|nr:PPOX class F420-dependent oxidoreductase [Novosphingobium sp.]